MIGSATYSPDDNKLRLYPLARLAPETYAKVKAAGFKWAPKQELFVAPMWTPGREDLLVELCGEIGDEDTSLIDRAEDRAERFEDYREKRTGDAERAREAVAAIADSIPLGQPILVGHHSERHARKDAERIENGMRRAVKMWETAQYWKSRAAGAIRHAKYKERPDVRARRIKGLEADQRKQQRNKAEAEKARRLWGAVLDDAKWKKADGSIPPPVERASYIANANHLIVARDGQSMWSAWEVLRPDGERYAACPSWTVEQVQVVAAEAYARSIAHAERWLAHLENRLAYERAMLADAGGTVADRTGPEVDGGVKCWASPRGGWSYVVKVNKVSVTVHDNWGNGGGNFTRNIAFDKLAAVMSAADVQSARDAGRLIEAKDGCGFFLVEPAPSTAPCGLVATIQAPPTASPDAVAPDAPRPPTGERAKVPSGPTGNHLPVDAPRHTQADLFAVLRDQLRAGVKVVTVPQLFETPPALAGRVVDLARVPAGGRVLEPNAGTGNLLRALPGVSPFPSPCRQTWAGEVVAVEINPQLADALEASGLAHRVECADFLSCNGDLGTFDRIVMNPPFKDAADVAHILYARGMLNPGGRLVAICANGPRQQAKLKPLASMWEELPPGTFEGTGVHAALLVIEG